MKHRDIDYAVEEDRPGIWRWIIYPKIEAGPKVVSEPKVSDPGGRRCGLHQRDSITPLRGVSMPRDPKASLVHYYTTINQHHRVSSFWRS